MLSRTGRTAPAAAAADDDAVYTPPAGFALAKSDAVVASALPPIRLHTSDGEDDEDDGTELWLIRMPDTVTAADFDHVQLTLSADGHVQGVLARAEAGKSKPVRYTVASADDADNDADARSFVALLPDPQKPGSLRPAKPFARHLTVTRKLATGALTATEEDLPADADAPPYEQPPGLGLVGSPFGAASPAKRRKAKPAAAAAAPDTPTRTKRVRESDAT